MKSSAHHNFTLFLLSPVRSGHMKPYMILKELQRDLPTIGWIQCDLKMLSHRGSLSAIKMSFKRRNQGRCDRPD